MFAFIYAMPQPGGASGDMSVAAGSCTGLVSAFVDLVAGSTTTITFTNRSTLGTLRVCKVGTGFDAGTSFQFNVFNTAGDGGNTQLDVTVGEGRDATVPDGNYQVLESVPAGLTVTAIEWEPVERCAGSANVPLGYRSVDVAGGMRSTLTFTNATAAPFGARMRATGGQLRGAQ